jgi:tetratricopeptide (TPR) repeat protein
MSVTAASITATSFCRTGMMHASKPYDPAAAARRAAYRVEFSTWMPAAASALPAARHASHKRRPSQSQHVTFTVKGHTCWTRLVPPILIMGPAQGARSTSRTTPHAAEEGNHRLPIRVALAAIAILVLAASPQRAAASATPVASASAADGQQDFSADIARAKDLQRQGRAKDAIALLSADHKAAPGDRDVTVALAQTYSYAGDQGDAIQLLDALLAATPDDVDARVDLAQAYAFNHDYAAAEDQYHHVLAIAPADEDGEVGLGQTYTFEGRYADAKTLFQKILNEDPKNSDARVGLAGAEGFSGQYKAAEAEYKAVLGDQPDNTDALVGLATVEYWLGNITAATQFNERALALNSGDSDARELARQLAIKTSPQIVSTNTGTQSNDGVTNDYLLQERYYTDASTSVGLMQELYQISSDGVFVQSHRLGVVATYQGPSQFGVDLRVDESRFDGVPAVTDDVLTLTGANNGFNYGIGQSEGGVDGSVQANGGEIVAGQRSALVRIDALFANAGYTRRASTLNLTAQDASYNDGNRFEEVTADLSHQFGFGASVTITPDIGFRNAGFTNTYNDVEAALSPGYYDYDSQRDLTASAAAVKSFTDSFSAGITATLGERQTVVPVYSRYPVVQLQSSPGTLPFQSFDPYIDYEGDRFAVTAAYYDSHYSGGGAVMPFAATTASLNIAIRLP